MSIKQTNKTTVSALVLSALAGSIMAMEPQTAKDGGVPGQPKRAAVAQGGVAGPSTLVAGGVQTTPAELDAVTEGLQEEEEGRGPQLVAEEKGEIEEVEEDGRLPEGEGVDAAKESAETDETVPAPKPRAVVGENSAETADAETRRSASATAGETPGANPVANAGEARPLSAERVGGRTPVETALVPAPRESSVSRAAAESVPTAPIPTAPIPTAAAEDSEAIIAKLRSELKAEQEKASKAEQDLVQANAAKKALEGERATLDKELKKVQSQLDTATAAPSKTPKAPAAPVQDPALAAEVKKLKDELKSAQITAKANLDAEKKRADALEAKLAALQTTTNTIPAYVRDVSNKVTKAAEDFVVGTNTFKKDQAIIKSTQDDKQYNIVWDASDFVVWQSVKGVDGKVTDTPVTQASQKAQVLHQIPLSTLVKLEADQSGQKSIQDKVTQTATVQTPEQFFTVIGSCQPSAFADKAFLAKVVERAVALPATEVDKLCSLLDKVTIVAAGPFLANLETLAYALDVEKKARKSDGNAKYPETTVTSITETAKKLREKKDKLNAFRSGTGQRVASWYDFEKTVSWKTWVFNPFFWPTGCFLLGVKVGRVICRAFGISA